MAREEGAVGHTRDEVGIAGEVEVDIEEVIAVAVDTGATEVAEVPSTRVVIGKYSLVIRK